MAMALVFSIIALSLMANQAATGLALTIFGIGASVLIGQSFVGMPIERAFVVHGEPGWDEPTPVGRFTLFDVQPGEVIEERLPVG